MNSELARIVREQEGYLLNIVGPSGSGKTSKLFHILQHWFGEDVEFAFRNYDQELIGLFPERIRSRSFTFRGFREILNVPCIVVLDDLPAQAYSGEYGKTASMDFIRQLTFDRHNDHKFLATSQNDQLVLKGLLESVDVYNLLSRMLPSQTATCRDPEYQENANQVIKIIEEEYPEIDSRAISFCPETDEVFVFPDTVLDPKIGKPFRGCVVEEGKLIRV